MRAILNYGHTIGHAIEAATSYKRYRHGEAVLLGMIAASELAARRGLWESSADRERHEQGEAAAASGRHPDSQAETDDIRPNGPPAYPRGVWYAA